MGNVDPGETTARRVTNRNFSIDREQDRRNNGEENKEKPRGPNKET